MSKDLGFHKFKTLTPKEKKQAGIGWFNHAMETMAKNRTLFLVGEVDSDSTSDLIVQLLYLNTLDKKEPIKLMIHSPGGCVMSGMQLMDVMHIIDAPVHTVVMGMAASMGAAILSAGEKGHRYAFESSQILVHQVSSGTMGHVKDMKADVEHTDKLNFRLMEKIAAECGMPHKKLLKLVERDKWISAKEAKEFGTKGIIDVIIKGK